MTRKFDFRLSANINDKKELDIFIDSLLLYQTGSSNNLLCEYCTGKSHEMKQIYQNCASASCSNR